MKRCPVCGVVKPLEEFHRDRSRADGRTGLCRICGTAATRKWQDANVERVKEKAAKYKRANLVRNRDRARLNYTPEKGRRVALARYRMTPEAYNALLAAQGGKCALCPRTKPVRSLVVDHDHTCCPTTPTCGRCNRGLLCSSCNQAIVALDRDPEWAIAAHLYLGEAMLARSRALSGEVA